MGRLVWAAALAAGCGSASGPAAPDAEVRTLDSIQITGKAKLSWTLTTKLTATATFSDGKTLDITPNVTWSSSDPTIATVAADGTVTAVAEGDSTIKAAYEGQDGSLAFHTSMPTLLVSSYGAQRIDAFPANATGNIAPLHSISGATTTLGAPRGLFVSGNELFVADQGGQAIDVFPLDGSGNIAPTRQIKGASTLLSAPSQIYVTDTEIYVGDQSDSVYVFPKTGTGNIAPTRQIKPTGLAGSLGVVVYKDELYVSSYTQSEIYVVPATSNGAVAPTRTLVTPDGYLAAPQAISVFDDELFVANGGNSITVFDPQFSSMAPYRRLRGTTTQLSYPDQFAQLGTKFYSANYSNSTVQVFDLVANGDTAPLATIGGAMTKINGDLGLVLYGVDE